MSKLLFKSGDDWTFELIEKATEVIEDIALNDMKLDVYPNQIEIITAEQMLDAYASIGLPINYRHWSFGKEFIMNQKAYSAGDMGLAYEIVINSNPCISYCMEENDMMMQALVIAHAAFGHNSVFKNNYLFKQWTDAEAIVDYLSFAKNYISMCEEKYGEDEVEQILDSCHAIMDYGVDKYKRPPALSSAEEERKALERFDYELKGFNDLWRRTVPEKATNKKVKKFPSEPQENILYFIEKNAPSLPAWKREIIRIIRKIAQYFYPQSQMKIVHEGFATFTHYYIMSKMYDDGYIDEGTYMAFLKSHTNVTLQPVYHSEWYSGMNPYAIGFAIFQDIKRICENPTEEDKRWFPQLIGMDWRDAVKDAMTNYKDDSFIAQFLSPKVIRDFKLFRITDNEDDDYIEITAIQDDDGYREIRTSLSNFQNRDNWIPDIQVTEVDINGDRSLTLTHYPYRWRPLDEESAREVAWHVNNLWEYGVNVQTALSDPDTKEEILISICKTKALPQKF